MYQMTLLLEPDDTLSKQILNIIMTYIAPIIQGIGSAKHTAV